MRYFGMPKFGSLRGRIWLFWRLAEFWWSAKIWQVFKIEGCTYFMQLVECDLRWAPYYFCQWWTLPFTNNSGRHTVTLWSVYWTLVPEVWVQDLAESMCFVLGQDTLLSPCLSPPRSINGYWWIVREAWWNAGGGGGTLWWTGIPSRGELLLL